MPLDLDSLHLADKGNPLENTSPLKAQESEDGRICLLLSLELCKLSHSLQVSEPSALDHEALDLLRLLLLEPSCGI